MEYLNLVVQALTGDHGLLVQVIAGVASGAVATPVAMLLVKLIDYDPVWKGVNVAVYAFFTSVSMLFSRVIGKKLWESLEDPIVRRLTKLGQVAVSGLNADDSIADAKV